MNDNQKHNVNIHIADQVAYRGKCKRAKVGCIITQHGRIVSSGFNGPIEAEVTCEMLGCDISQPCEHSVHAEANAIVFAARMGISLQGATLYCTVAPCKECSWMIIQAGIKEVVYRQAFRDEEGIIALLKNKVICRKLL